MILFVAAITGRSEKKVCEVSLAGFWRRVREVRKRDWRVEESQKYDGSATQTPQRPQA